MGLTLRWDALRRASACSPPQRILGSVATVRATHNERALDGFLARAEFAKVGVDTQLPSCHGPHRVQ